MRCLVFVFVFMITYFGLTVDPAVGERVFLNNGDMIEGSVIGKTPEFTILMEKTGRPRKISAKEINRIESDAVAISTEDTEQGGPDDESSVYQGAELQGGDSGEMTIDDPRFTGMTTHDLVVKLLQVNGMQESMKENVVRILALAPEDKRVQLGALMDVDDVIEAIVPIYETHFTANELKRLILFYEDDLGKKLIRITPKISEEVTQAAAAYFKQKLQK